MPDLSRDFEIAREHHRAGRVAEAERLYREILDLVPDQPDTLHLLGVLRLQAGCPEEAVEMIADAARAVPDEPRFHANLGHALNALGRGREAALAFARALVLVENGGEPWVEVGSLAELIRRREPEARKAAVDLVAQGLTGTDAIRRLSLLFHLSGDIRWYRDLAERVVIAPPPINALRHVYWGVTLRLFQGAAEIGDAGAFHAGPLDRVWRTLVAETSRTLADSPTPRRSTGEIRRIAIVTNQMLGEGHQPTVDALDLAHRIRADHGIETLIVNTDALPARTESGFVPEYNFNVTREYREEFTLRARGMEARMVSHPDLIFDRAGIASVLASIDDFDPDVVVGFGGGNLFADLAARSRPVVCLPTSSGFVHSSATLVLGYSVDDATGGRSGAEAARFRPHSFGFAIPEDGPDLPRSAFGLPEDGDLFVVVGNRLDVEVTDAFLDVCEALIARLPSARLVFAGAVETLAGRLAARDRAERLHAPGHVDAVRSLYRHATAFVSPPRQGGGGSAAAALAEGLPVVTTRGDTAAVAGAAATVADDAAMIEACVRLATDPAHRAERVAEARARFAAIGDRRDAAARLVERCREAAALFA